MRRIIVTRAQAEAVYRLFVRHHDGFTSDHSFNTATSYRYGLGEGQKLFPGRVWRLLYRMYRRRFQTGGFAGDYYLFGQPFTQGEGQLWVGIEPDGYTHS